MGLKLIVESTESASPTIPVRWCVDRATLEEMQRRGVRHPYVLLVVRSEEQSRREQRMLVPMHELASYVSFVLPGKNTVYAILVYPPGGTLDRRLTEKWLWSEFLSRSLGDYNTSLFNPVDGSLLSYMTGGHAATSVTVSVPAELFAPKPPSWEKEWVNLWFESAPKDQCAYRRRRVIAYTIQPPIMLIHFLFYYILFALGALGNLLVGRFDLNWEKFHPRNICESHVYLMPGGVRSLARRSLWLIPLTPIVPLGAAGIAAGVMLLLKAPFNPWLPWLIAVGVVLGLWAGALLVIGFIGVYSFLVSTLENVFRAWGRKRQEARRAAAARGVAPPAALPAAPPLYLVRSAVLSCDSIGPSPMVIPREYQTLHYRIQALKARVCRPFAW